MVYYLVRVLIIKLNTNRILCALKKVNCNIAYLISIAFYYNLCSEEEGWLASNVNLMWENGVGSLYTAHL